MSTSGSKPNGVTFVTLNVKASAAIVKGVGVYISAANEVDVATANSKVYGVADETVTGNSSGTSRVRVAIAAGGTIRVKASGTATRGEYAIAGTDGFENQTIGGGTTVKYLVGQFVESGVDGDFVECKLGSFAAGCA
jgi:hypothetical protein